MYGYNSVRNLIGCFLAMTKHYFLVMTWHYLSYNQLQKWWDTSPEKRPFLLQIAPGHRAVKYNTDLSPSSLPFKVVPPSFEYGPVLLATLIRGGGGITSTRSWTGHLCQNTVQCLKYFCNWLSHLRFTSTSNFHVLNSQNEDYSDINKIIEWHFVLLFPTDTSLSLIANCLKSA